MNRASQTGMKEVVLATAQRCSVFSSRKGAKAQFLLLCETYKRSGK